MFVSLGTALVYPAFARRGGMCWDRRLSRGRDTHTMSIYALLLTSLLLALVACQESDNQTDSGPRETHLLPAWDKRTPGLRIELPPGFHVVTEKGVDFDVHRIFDSTTSGRATGRRIGIYVGHHPGLFATEERPKKTLIVRGKVANHSVRWQCWETIQRDSICETLVKGVYESIRESEVSALVLHLWVSASAAAELAQLRGLPASVRLALEEHGRTE
jgi:hypothetical protein